MALDEISVIVVKFAFLQCTSALDKYVCYLHEVSNKVEICGFLTAMPTAFIFCLHILHYSQRDNSQGGQQLHNRLCFFSLKIEHG